MAFGTRTTRSSRRSRRRRVKPKTKVDKNLDRRIKKLEEEPEMKYYYNYSTVTMQYDQNAPYCAFVCLNLLQQGTSTVTRIGSEVQSKLLELRLVFRQVNNMPNDTRIRYTIFWAKNMNTIVPLYNQLYNTDAAGTGSSTNPTVSLSMFNRYYADSFKIIMDRTIELKPLDWNGTGTTIPDMREYHIRKRISRKVKYIPGIGAGLATDIVDNGLFIAFSTSTIGATSQPFCEMTSRYSYIDC